MKTIIAFLLLSTPAFATPDDDAVAVAIAIANAQHVSTPIAEKAAAAWPHRWDSENNRWVTASGNWWIEVGGNTWKLVEQQQYKTIPAQGHWEKYRCGRNGCDYRWVIDVPASRVRVEGTALKSTDVKAGTKRAVLPSKVAKTPRKQATSTGAKIHWPSYPTRSVSGRRWTQNGHVPTAQHLAGGHHSHERFDYQWLRTLSSQQRTALASDSHEGRVRDAFVVRE